VSFEPPARLRTRYGKWAWSVVWEHDEGTTWRIGHHDGTVHFLKVGHTDRRPSAFDEAPRLRWARAFLPVPDVLEYGRDDGVEWLLTVGLDGIDATRHPLLTDDPTRLVAILARGLAEFHARAPAEECPFEFGVETALAHVRRRVVAGCIDPARDFHEIHAHFTPESALAELERLAPDDEDRVVCHGDYCFPNVLVDDDGVTGFLDLGELGVADRWWDVAVGSWSVDWNIEPGYDELFVSAYGLEPDPGRLAFYRLLYDLAS
jgi:kanamycin kinase